MRKQIVIISSLGIIISILSLALTATPQKLATTVSRGPKPLPPIASAEREAARDLFSKCNESRLRENGGDLTEVIFPSYKTSVERGRVKFTDIDWINYEDRTLGISFDFPKEIYTLQKVTVFPDGHKESYGTYDYYFIFSNCLSYSYEIRFIYSGHGFFYTDSKYKDPAKFSDNNPSLFSGTVTDAFFANQKARLMVNNAPQQIPSDSYLIYPKSSNGENNRLVEITFPKLDIESYLRHNGISWGDEEKKRYQEFDVKIAKRVLNSIKFR